jgi:hypothetical protein
MSCAANPRLRSPDICQKGSNSKFKVVDSELRPRRKNRWNPWHMKLHLPQMQLLPPFMQLQTRHMQLHMSQKQLQMLHLHMQTSQKQLHLPHMQLHMSQKQLQMLHLQLQKPHMQLLLRHLQLQTSRLQCVPAGADTRLAVAARTRAMGKSRSQIDNFQLATRVLPLAAHESRPRDAHAPLLGLRPNFPAAVLNYQGNSARVEITTIKHRQRG